MSNQTKGDEPARIPQGVALALIKGERAYQEFVKGFTNPHQVGAWITVLQHKLTDAIAAWTTNPGDQRALAEIVQIAAVATACLECQGGKLFDVEYQVVNEERWKCWQLALQNCGMKE